MRRLLKPGWFLLCLGPFLYCAGEIGYYLTVDQLRLGPDPGKVVVQFLGETALVMLLLTLALTPVQRIFRLRVVVLRRMTGLFAFFYASLHVVSYIGFLLGFEVSEFYADLLKRPYITAGMGALLILVPLAATSTAKLRRKLGANWKRLHRGVYLAAILAIIHLFWQTRSDFTESLAYSALLFGLLGYRIVSAKRRE